MLSDIYQHPFCFLNSPFALYLAWNLIANLLRRQLITSSDADAGACADAYINTIRLSTWEMNGSDLCISLLHYLTGHE